MNALPQCFDYCVQDVNTGSGLNSDEKNCMRECFLKKMSSRDDMSVLTTQMMARENLKQAREVNI